MMWFLLVLVLFNAHIEPLKVIAGKVILKRGKEACSGYVEIYHEEQWGYVGHTYWNNSTEKVVCRSTHCGEPEKGSSHMELRSMDRNVWLDEVQCNGTEKDLLSCKYPGLDLNNFRDDYVRTIKCTNEIKISLDGYKCAGAVRYSTRPGAALGYFCADNFDQAEANLLCRSLDCGDSKEIPRPPGWFGREEFKSSEKMKIKCYNTENLTNLWQCADQETSSCQNPASVICTDFVRVQLKGNGSNVCSGQLEKEENEKWIPVKENNSSSDVCQLMHCGTSVSKTNSNNEVNVKCSDNVSVVLLDNNREGKCYGAVHVEVNNTRYPVCASTWTREEAQVVCSEKNCGSVLTIESKTEAGVGIMDNVKCFGSESSLWHCFGFREKTPFRCNSKAYVVCSGSVDVRLADSPGRCAGRLEIQHKGKWQRVNQKSWQDTNSDLVCNHLQCGNKRRTSNAEDQYSQGSGDFVTVTCDQSASKISECITNEDKTGGQKEAVRITCEKHSMVFLDGKNSCSGMVGIEQDNKMFWLSGSNKTWTRDVADTVCRQMHCGEALNFNSTSNTDEKKEFWNETYSCSSNSISLFECQKTAPPLKHTDIATVICTGNKKVNLTKECWGNVNICVGGECGSVFGDTWTEKKSQMLCENLKCGNAILNTKNPLPVINVSFKSVHATEQTSDISQCNFIKNNDFSKKAAPAFVVCSESVNTRITADNRDKCCGNVEVFFEGQWLPVCKDALKDNTETQNSICGEQNCGQAVEMNDFFGPQPSSPSISLIKCNSGEKSLKNCTISSDVTPCKHAGLQCSRCRKMELKTEKDCIKGKACSGAVMVYSGKDRSTVSVDGWSKTEMNRLCKDLKCGNVSKHLPFTAMTESFWNTSFSCARENNPENIWACEDKTAPLQKDALYIECQDEPAINFSRTCGGEVTIDNISVCDTNWHNDYSDLVCKEKGCIKAVGHFSKKVPSSKDEYYHVRCEKYHSKLGQCRRFKAKCYGKLVSVYCVREVKFRTTEKCGGKIQVNYRNEWENMCLTDASITKYKPKLCETLQCATHNATIHTSTNTLRTTLNCNTVPDDVTVCVHHSPCTGLGKASIYCPGHNDPDKSTITLVPIILGVGILLVLVIMAIVFIRIYIVRKNKRATNATSRMSKMEEVEFESGDYEDVNTKANEMEDLRRLRPEAELITEGDAQSLPSLSYDDVDVNEALFEARPLTSQASFAVVSGDNLTFEDQVAYEVDDPQENYDDIEHSPKIPQTKATVHDGSRTTPARAGLLKGDEDYLEPGEDG
nr:scavenger receptor cysteine-rich type 1 protein M130-like isoform X1 [Labrus bergylta]